jgi:DNA repair exonuclease SbcCD ATPase subunit
VNKKRSEYVGDFLTIDYEVPLRQKIADLEAKFAESEKRFTEENKEKCDLKTQLEYIKDEIEVNFVDGQKYNELKQQLAEREEQLNNSEQKCLICTKDQENEQLKQQLAEKDEEIEKLKEVVNCVDKLKQFNADMKDYALVNRDVADEIYCEHQDKIAFAVEQLEKVKEKLSEDINNVKPLLDPTEYEDYNQLIGVIRGYRNSIYEIQKLITEIKGEK